MCVLRFAFLIIFSFAVVNARLDEEDKDCRRAKHEFLVTLEPNPSSDLKGLGKYTYTFFFLSSLKTVGEYQIAFEGSFPVNVNVELSPDIIYSFQSTYTLCLNDVFKERQVTLLGDLKEYRSNNVVLNEIWIKIGKVLFSHQIYSEDTQATKSQFFLMTPYTSNLEVLLMKVLNQNNAGKNEQFFQIVKSTITEYNNNGEKEKSSEFTGIPIGTKITFQLEKKNPSLKEGQSYIAYTTIGGSIKYFNFNVVLNYVCKYWNEKEGKFNLDEESKNSNVN